MKRPSSFVSPPFLLGSFRSRALTGTTDKNTIKHHRLNRNPIHVPGFSLHTTKKAVSGSSISFLITPFYISHSGARPPDLQPEIHLQYIVFSECSPKDQRSH